MKNNYVIIVRSHLPPHMIPSIFMVLERLPLNSNGKVDRKSFFHNQSSLNTHRLHLQKMSLEVSSPRNEIEATIHQIWCEYFSTK